MLLQGFILGKPVSFIIDSGAERSVLPKSLVPDSLCMPTNVQLSGVDGKPLNSYGQFNATVAVRSLRRDFKVNFILTNTQPILGADFLINYGLNLNMKLKKLSDPLTTLSATLNCKQSNSVQIRVSESKIENSYLKNNFPSLISAPDYSFIPEKLETFHEINTNSSPVFCKPRPLSPEKFDAAKKEFDQLLELKIIQPSSSPWSSPLHMVPKPDGSWRPCGDYRRVNAITTPDRYSIPNINHIHNKMAGSKVFSKLDLIKAYHFIPVRKEDIAKTAICTPFGNYEYVRMPFGLRNASSTFQRFMDSIFRDMDFVATYIDDIIIFSRSETEHKIHVETVCKKLDFIGLKVNEKKSCFFLENVPFLGYSVSSKGIKPLSDRISALQDLPPPSDKKILQRYLGMFGFYQKCVPKFSDQSKLLRDLLKQKDFDWTDHHTAAFNSLKKSLCDATELRFPVPGAPLSITADASSTAIGAVLHQTVDEEIQPLAFFSRNLSDCEKRYSTFDRELLAIFASTKKWKGYISGAKLTVFTDHKPLVGALKNLKERDSDRQARQISFLLEYVADIIHIAGKCNIVADTLSRPLEKSNICNLASGKNILIDLISIAKEQQNIDIIPNLKAFKINDIDLHCDISSANPRPYIPEKLREEVFHSLHDLSHSGWKATCRLVGSRYFWPTLKADVKKLCSQCEACQSCKVTRHVKRPLGELPTPTQRFTNVHIDIVGPLEQITTYGSPRYLITMIDAHTRWLEAIPVAEITADIVCKTFLFHWVARFGPPLYIISDKGTQFSSELLANLTKFLGVHQIRTSAYNPKANGMVERSHRTLKAALRARSGNWVDQLAFVLLGIRMRPDGDGSSAYARVTGEQPIVPHILTEDVCMNDVVDSLNKVTFPYKQPRSRETKHYIPPLLQSCEYVWLRLDRVRKPMEAPYQGPFQVKKRSNTFFTIMIRGKESNVAIERLKPAILAKAVAEVSLPDVTSLPAEEPNVDTPASGKKQTRSGRHVQFKKSDTYQYY